MDTKKVSVKIPAGVDNGSRLRLNGEGEAGMYGGPPGDLYVVISVTPHDVFERDGRDLHTAVPLQFPQAALGTEVEVETLDGTAKVKIPEGTQSGRVFRLRGKGLPSLRTAGRGDQLVHIYVEVPTRLSKRERELLEALAEESGGRVSPPSRSILERIRTMFE